MAMSVLLLAGLGACGNLENAPLRVGTIQGQLTEFDPAVATVSLVDRPEVSTTVDGLGRFTLEGVPTGPVDLFIIATAEKATRVSVKVAGGQRVDVKRVAPRVAGFLELRVRATHGERMAGAQVAVQGTPFSGLPLDGGGRLRVGPLPDGCYALTLVGSSFPEAQSTACVGEGEKKELRLELELNAEFSNRCSLTGCADGLVCRNSGQCVECVEDDQCGEGMRCKGFRCGAAGPECGACTKEGRCGGGAVCLLLPEGDTACVKECTESLDDQGENEDIAASRCEAGFTCQRGRCLPDPNRFLSCQALAQFGAECADDARCRSLGLATGVCVDGLCTVPCAEDLECPGESRCEDSSVGLICSVRR
ncbi:carboxypeptidase regulatory-like domain-containing protein [Myxococcus sp. K15C18031901]|uniref:carboxypeptidase-like regulatory domain-containing protein n=1 Tax=Myxococcus dinghuensis TaxID=2906761 RepID=UPI0020A7E1E4|nr:carboxypeptidase-like regulatory domain-containing protein [Myxococcus dinghuensis]MCP3104412.1 carboxypeptidase regulatory-like domain-containing protein [Myxococcus dinghuensis]